MTKKGFHLFSSLLMLVSLVMVSAASLTPTAGSSAVAATTSTTVTTTTTVQAEVIVPALNIHQGPGVDYGTSGTASQGDTFEVVGTDRSRYWLQIKQADGTLAWLSGGSAYTSVSGPVDNLPVAQLSVAQSGSLTATATPGAMAASPTSNAGGKLAFMNASGGNIYLINADGSNLRLLVQGGLDPALSPDGQQVAFTRWGMSEGVYLINVDGTNERQVHPAHWPKSPSWSAEGTQLVFNFQHGGRVDKVKECKITDTKNPNLPPDAYDVNRKTIEEDEEYEFCYWLPPKPSWALRKVDLTTGDYQDLSSDYTSFGPAWDPREQWRVVYSGDANLVQLDLNRQVRMTLQEGIRDHTPAFSPDGMRLAVAYRQEDGQWRIDLLNMDTAERISLATEGNNISPTWSPAGEQIAFLTDRTGQWEVWVMNRDGSNQRPMFAAGTLADITFTFDEVDERMLSWGP